MPHLHRNRTLLLVVCLAVWATLLPSLPDGPASAAPAAPAFGPGIDPYASYVGQSVCDPAPKAGTLDFSNIVRAAYPWTGSYGISRDCGVGGQSEHKEGRAWDWKVSASNGQDVAAVDDLIRWLLATDQYGNTHAMARRFGLMYIIWNGYMWRAYRPWDGWQPYTGSNPHTDHVHFSFGWDGARGWTTWWGGKAPDRDYSIFTNYWADRSETNGNGTDAVSFGGGLHVFAAPPSGAGLAHAAYSGDRFNWPSQVLDAGGGSTGRNVKSIQYAGELHAFNERAGGGIRHLVYSGGRWYFQDLDVGASSGQSVEVIASLGELHVYSIRVGGGIRHLVWSQGRWWTQDLDVGNSTGAGGISAIEMAGQLHLFTQRSGGNGIRHIVYSAAEGRYYFEDLDVGGNDGTFVTSALYAGELHVASRVSTSGGIRHINYSPVTRRWYQQSLDTDGSLGMFTKMVVFNGDLHIFSTPLSGLGIRHDYWRASQQKWESLSHDTYDPTGWWLSAVNVGSSLWVAGHHTSGTGIWALQWP